MLLLLLLAVVSVVTCDQRFVQEPQDVTSSAGGRLVLPCRVEARRGECQWTRDGFGLGVKTSLPGFPRYTMSEAGDLGDCDLIIDPVLPADEAVYQCQVMGPGPLVS